MKPITTLSPLKAYELLQHNPQAKLIDIRSSMEYLFVGHPVGAVHIPWIDDPDWSLNPDFVSDTKKLVNKENDKHPLDSPLIIICRSGVRTLQAADVLIEAGFTQIIHIDEGFEGDRDDDFHRSSMGGWRYHGLPWEQC